MRTTLPPSLAIKDIGKMNAFFLGKIVELNDKRIVVNREASAFRNVHYYLALFGMIALLVAAIVTHDIMPIEENLTLIFILFMFFTIIIVLFLGIIFQKKFKKQYIILDREHKTIIQPISDYSTEYASSYGNMCTGWRIKLVLRVYAAAERGEATDRMFDWGLAILKKLARNLLSNRFVEKM